MIRNDLPLTLYQKAGRVVRGAINNSPKAEESMVTFFKHANEKNIQGPALTAYYSAVLNANKEVGEDCFRTVTNSIENHATKNSKLKNELVIFAKALNKNYKKTLKDRICLLTNGAIHEDKVEPKSKFRKFITVLSRLIRE